MDAAFSVCFKNNSSQSYQITNILYGKYGIDTFIPGWSLFSNIQSKIGTKY